MAQRQEPCQFCRKQKYWADNALKVRFPKLFKQLHPSRNQRINIDGLKWSDARRVWWLCPKGHAYKTTVVTRTQQGTGCSLCKGSTSKPELRAYSEFAAFFPDCRLKYRANKNEIDVFLPQIKCGIEYDGSYWHKGKEGQDRKKNNRLSDLGITLFRIREEPLGKINALDVIVPTGGERFLKHAIKQIARNIVTAIDLPNELSVQLLSYAESRRWADLKGYHKIIARLPAPPEGYSLRDEYPDVAEDWDYIKNHPLRPEMFRSQAHDTVHWRCKNGHAVRQRIQNRVNAKRGGCHECARLIRGRITAKRAAARNPLGKRNPTIAAEWHPSKNKGLTPEDVSASSGRKVWWLCQHGHAYQAKIQNRTARGFGCQFCSGNAVGYGNSLLDLHADIARTWCDELNGDLGPDQVTPKSGKKVWWRCANNHRWKQQIRARVQKGVDGCMECRTLANRFPDLSQEWHPTKNETLKPSRISAHSGKNVWWVCKTCGHEWKTTVHKRTSSHAGCPECAKKTMGKTRRDNLAFSKRLINSHPDARLIWDYSKNAGVDLTTIPTYSDQEVWFKCPQGRSYKQKVVLATTRKNLLYCPACKKVHSKEEFTSD
jgi:hypothetical protein